MNVTLSIVADDEALAEVQLVEVFDRLVRIPNVQMGPVDRSGADGRVVRFGVLELLATFVTSAAAYQLAVSLRDFVKRQMVDIELTHPDGRRLSISAKGKHLEDMAEMVAFLTGQSTEFPKSRET